MRPLTPKQIQASTLVGEGLSSRELAKIIGTTEQVVEDWLRTPFDQLGVCRRLELAPSVNSHGGANPPGRVRVDSGPSPLRPPVQPHPEEATSCEGCVPLSYTRRLRSVAEVGRASPASLARNRSKRRLTSGNFLQIVAFRDDSLNPPATPICRGNSVFRRSESGISIAAIHLKSLRLVVPRRVQTPTQAR